LPENREVGYRGFTAITSSALRKTSFDYVSYLELGPIP